MKRLALLLKEAEHNKQGSKHPVHKDPQRMTRALEFPPDTPVLADEYPDHR
jgi:hypothetical protein